MATGALAYPSSRKEWGRDSLCHPLSREQLTCSRIDTAHVCNNDTLLLLHDGCGPAHGLLVACKSGEWWA